MSDERDRVAGKWSSDEIAADYATRRFRSSRAGQRDVSLVAGCLRDHGVRGRVLDAPCGTGRLSAMLARAGELTSVDVSPAMLAHVSSARRVAADAARLPFRDRQFDVVVCCRLLHHMREPNDLERVVRELVRVSDRLVIASFWDSAALPAWRSRVGLARPRGRNATSRAAIAAAFEHAGATAKEFRAVLRFVSQQTFVVALRP